MDVYSFTIGKDRVKNKKYAIDSAFEIEKDKVFLTMLDKKRGRALDCGAGDGRFSRALKDMGFEVHACDFDSEFFKQKIPFKKVDLSKKLPYAKSSFDVVVLREVIEHMENQAFVISELHRILKNGGLLLIETPNVHSLTSKLIFFFTGYFNQFYGDYITWIGHTHPLFVWNLKRFAKDKFEIERLFFPFGVIPILRIRLPFGGIWVGDSLMAKLRKRRNL